MKTPDPKATQNILTLSDKVSEEELNDLLKSGSTNKDYIPELDYPLLFKEYEALGHYRNEKYSPETMSAWTRGFKDMRYSTKRAVQSIRAIRYKDEIYKVRFSDFIRGETPATWTRIKEEAQRLINARIDLWRQLVYRVFGKQTYLLSAKECELVISSLQEGETAMQELMKITEQRAVVSEISEEIAERQKRLHENEGRALENFTERMKEIATEILAVPKKYEKDLVRVMIADAVEDAMKKRY